MFFRQYYLGCLSHASYLIGDEATGRAVVVDPQRDIAQYLEDASANGLTIERVIETHFHADFLSGHLELTAATGATISYGEAAAGRPEYEVDLLRDGERLVLGRVVLEIRATPGHTPESISVVVYEDADADPYGVLTGDTLFIGDVGRPDLLTSVGVSADTLARQLFHSLHDKLLTLPDATRVFPAHGAGSACGKQLSNETASTIGVQRRVNYALQPMSEDDFVHAVTEGQTTAPLYFAFAARRNTARRATLDEGAPVPTLALADVFARVDDGAIVLDARDPATFARGHLRGAINVEIEGRFAEYAGEVIEAETPIVLVTEPGSECEARNRLARIGFDTVVGALDAPYRTMAENPGVVEQASRLTASDVDERIDSVAGLVVVDVRAPGETELGAIPAARLLPLPELLSELSTLDPDAPTIVYCASGVRSSIAASVLSSRGWRDVSDVVGGYDAWRANRRGEETAAR